jgi:hypothetical protein
MNSNLINLAAAVFIIAVIILLTLVLTNQIG